MNANSRPGAAVAAWASCSRVTCRGDQATRTSWSRARQAISAGDIRAARRAYQPSREVAAEFTRAPACRSAGCPGPRSWPRWWRPATRTGSAWARRPRRPRRNGPPRRAAPCPGRRGPGSCRGPRPAQTVALRKLSSRALRPPPVASSVSFGYRTLPPVEVADHAAGAVGEPHGDLHVVGVRAADRVDLLGQAVRPPAQRVQEVTALAGEPRPLALVAVPAVGSRAGRR